MCVNTGCSSCSGNCGCNCQSCNSNQCNSCTSEPCGCASEHDFACVRYGGCELECLGLVEGQTLEQAFHKLDKIVCELNPGVDGVDGIDGQDGAILPFIKSGFVHEEVAGQLKLEDLSMELTGSTVDNWYSPLDISPTSTTNWGLSNHDFSFLEFVAPSDGVYQIDFGFSVYPAVSGAIPAVMYFSVGVNGALPTYSSSSPQRHTLEGFGAEFTKNDYSNDFNTSYPFLINLSAGDTGKIYFLNNFAFARFSWELDFANVQTIIKRIG